MKNVIKAIETLSLETPYISATQCPRVLSSAGIEAMNAVRELHSNARTQPSAKADLLALVRFLGMLSEVEVDEEIEEKDVNDMTYKELSAKAVELGVKRGKAEDMRADILEKLEVL